MLCYKKKPRFGGLKRHHLLTYSWFCGLMSWAVPLMILSIFKFTSVAVVNWQARLLHRFQKQQERTHSSVQAFSVSPSQVCQSFLAKEVTWLSPDLGEREMDSISPWNELQTTLTIVLFSVYHNISINLWPWFCYSIIPIWKQYIQNKTLTLHSQMH